MRPGAVRDWRLINGRNYHYPGGGWVLGSYVVDHGESLMITAPAVIGNRGPSWITAARGGAQARIAAGPLCLLAQQR